MSAEKLHQSLCHNEPRTTLNTGINLGIKILGTIKDCKSCGKAKAKQSKLSKVTESRSKVCGKRLHMDISLVKYKTMAEESTGCW